MRSITLNPETVALLRREINEMLKHSRLTNSQTIDLVNLDFSLRESVETTITFA